MSSSTCPHFPSQAGDFMSRRNLAHLPRVEAGYQRHDFSISYTSLLGTCTPPPDKPLPQLPSPRYNLFPEVRKSPRSPAHLSLISTLSHATTLSISEISGGEDAWDTDGGTISRADSLTLPPTPGLRHDKVDRDRSGADIKEQGLFFAVERKDGFVRFWVRLEVASLEGALELEGVPKGETQRLKCMAREIDISERREGMAERVQLLVGSYREEANALTTTQM